MPSNYTKKKGFTARGVQRYGPDLSHYLYNIDTLWLNVGSYYYDEVMDHGLRDLLIDGRESIQDDSGIDTVIELKIDDYENPIAFEVMSGNPPLYQYSIRNDSMAIYFSKHERENQLPMRIQLNQFLLWEKGVEGAYFESMCFLKALGFMPNEVKLNRVDFAVHSDQFKWTLEDMKTFSYPKNIKDDNKPNFYRLDALTGEFETMMVGDRSRLAMRIYNKSKEIEDKKKYYFYELYRKHGMNVENVWNVEIEVRRPFLKYLAEENDGLNLIFDDFNYCLAHDGLSRLWSLLMEKYTHKSAHWSMLSKLDKHFKFNQVHGLTVHKEIHSSFEREVPQILGRLSQAVLTEHDDSLENAIKMLYKAIPDYEKRQERKGKKIVTFTDRVKDKKSRIQNGDINITINNFGEKKKADKEKIRNEIKFGVPVERNSNHLNKILKSYDETYKSKLEKTKKAYSKE